MAVRNRGSSFAMKRCEEAAGKCPPPLLFLVIPQQHRKDRYRLCT